MAKSKEEIQRYIDDWQKENVKRYTIKVNREKYPEVINKLESVKSRQQYVIDLIKADIGK